MSKKAATTAKTTGATLVPTFAVELVEPSLAAIDALHVDTLVLSLTPSMRPLTGAAGFVDWRLCGELSSLLLRQVATGSADEKVLLPSPQIGAERILLVGWGADVRKNSDERFAWIIDALNGLNAKRVAFALPEPGRELVSAAQSQLRDGLEDRLVTLFSPER